MAGRLEGKVAVVTGGASGIGEATCRLFVREGVRGLVLADISEAAGMAIQAELRQVGGDVVFRRLDVGREAQWIETMQAVETRWGRLDVLVNNAGRGGVLIRPPVEHTTEEAMDVSFAVNAKGPLFGMKHAIPLMRKSGGGSIVNVVSIYTMIGDVLATAYAAGKGATRALTKMAAVQYAKEKIRVNSVFPGFVETGMTKDLHAQPEARWHRLDLTPLGILAVPEDIAYGIVYLASDESRYVTGSELVIDGGISSR
jgi:NAD(P)-dependent dehydrogenase (short-subunit alcohol dehydrogenase family)